MLLQPICFDRCLHFCFQLRVEYDTKIYFSTERYNRKVILYSLYLCIWRFLVDFCRKIKTVQVDIVDIYAIDDYRVNIMCDIFFPV